MSNSNKKCCGGIFADDIVLITPTEIKINAFFRYIFNWANKNKMSFGINIYTTMVIKLFKFYKLIVEYIK